MDLSAIPPEQLPFLPSLTPPNGTTSNFINPLNRGPAYIAVGSIFLGLAVISVTLRLYVRCILQKSAWWDDLLSVLALLAQSTYTGLNIWLCTHGVGKHMWDVHLLDFLDIIPVLRAMADSTEPAIGLTKLALLLLYYRLFSPNTTVKLAILFGIVFIFTVYTTLLFLFIFLERLETNYASKAMAVINVITDTYVLILPIYSVLKLYLPRGKKIGLALVFATGAFAVAMSIVGAVFRFWFADHGDDLTWSLLNVILVNSIECDIGIMCACMPLFPALLNSAHLISPDWMISMRSLRDRIFRSGAYASRGSGSGSGSHRSRQPQANKSADREDFVQLKPVSGASSLNNNNIGHSNSQNITKIKAGETGAGHEENEGIRVTTDFVVGRH